MNDNVIEVRDVSKLYQLGARRERYHTLRDTITEGFASLFRAKNAVTPELLWALRKVSFDVKRGEVVGLIGRNGAGKSTLLKVLSEITSPTEGKIEIHGRVGSLLEVGTGFHPELTGRENIFLNGAILGMTRAEIIRKFDEIVAFAEIEKFIDTPVKRYSSGMYVRLAFAVAAHLEPEILLVDEVLAVGDAQFQKKCMGKMSDVAHGEGRTIVFVSHNLAAIQELCHTAIVLDHGRVHCIREASEACEEYIRLVTTSAKGQPRVIHGGHFEVTCLRIQGDGNRLPAPLAPAIIRVDLRFAQLCTDPHVHLFVQTPEGETVFGLGSGDLSGNRSWPASREFTFEFRIASLPLLPGPHALSLKVRSFEQQINEMLDMGDRFEVAIVPVYGSATIHRKWHGLAAVDASLTVTPRS